MHINSCNFWIMANLISSFSRHSEGSNAWMSFSPHLIALICLQKFVWTTWMLAPSYFFLNSVTVQVLQQAIYFQGFNYIKSLPWKSHDNNVIFDQFYKVTYVCKAPAVEYYLWVDCYFVCLLCWHYVLVMLNVLYFKRCMSCFFCSCLFFPHLPFPTCKIGFCFIFSLLIVSV